MEMLTDLFIKNYVLLIMIGGMFMLTFFDVFLQKGMLIKLRVTLLMLFTLTVFDYLELVFSKLPASWYVIFMRTMCSAICYSMRPLIVMMMIFLVYRKARRLIAIPALLNVICAFSAFFTDISYHFDENNNFRRGPLGYTPYVVSVLYLLGFFVLSFIALVKHSSEESVIGMFLAVAASIAALFAFYQHEEVVNGTYAAEILLYYLYVYGQFTKRDTLTGLYNRQSFYSDLNNHRFAVAGIISIDMNELKWMNDTLGHEAGDTALKAVSEAFRQSVPSNERIYRIGGDEFIVICRHSSEGEIERLVEKMRSAVAESGCSCAFGMSCGKSADEMIKEADARMYEDKANIKAGIVASGGVLHNRD
ncbi:MAG: GGDEF domain-containing protein [Ruminiclostridium sp.]|nr:GGDEF domain-containing protein [Ruminiclostridium sp.]